jgi:hypothetical protein
MNTQLLHIVLKQVRDRFLAYFSSLNDADLRAILNGQSEMLLDILQQRYGVGRDQAKAAWNDLVLRYVDGNNDERALHHSPVYVEAAPRTGVHRPQSVRLPYNPGRRIA